MFNQKNKEVMETTEKTTQNSENGVSIIAQGDLETQIQQVRTVNELFQNIEIVNPQFQFLNFTQKGQSFIGIYKGKSHIDRLDKEFAIFLGTDACYYLSNNHNLMNLPNDLIDRPVRITYLGERTFKKDGEVKKVKLFSILTLAKV
jgi:hypothetical protein